MRKEQGKGVVGELLCILSFLLVIVMLIEYYHPLSILLSLYTQFSITDKERGGGLCNCMGEVWVGGNRDVHELVYLFLVIILPKA